MSTTQLPNNTNTDNKNKQTTSVQSSTPKSPPQSQTSSSALVSSASSVPSTSQASSAHKQPTAKPQWNVGAILAWMTQKFKDARISTPLLDAQILLGKALNFSKIKLYTESERPLVESEKKCLRTWITRRLAGEPVAYIINEKHWYDLTFYVDNNVLIPRPETELMVDFSLEILSHYQMIPNVIYDLCTGSGCLAVTLAKKYPSAQVIAVDYSLAALEIAKKNAAANDVTNITWQHLDLAQSASYEKLKQEFGNANIIVANPPYISLQDWQNLEPSVKDYEPKMALVSPDDGFYLARKIIKFVTEFKLQNENCIFSMEMGADQIKQLDDFNVTIPNLSFQTTASQKPLHTWFALCDLDSKARFLSYISTTHEPVTNQSITNIHNDSTAESTPITTHNS